MSSLSYKPLRKSVHLTQISDEEIRWKLRNRELAGEYFRRNTRARQVPAVSGPRIVPHGRGKIAHILFTIPGYYDQKNPEICIDPLDQEHFTTLIKHLSHFERRYTVLCHAQQCDVIAGWFRKAGISESHYTLCVSIFNYSIWAQDAYVALNDEEGRIVLAESICFTRDHDMTVADDLAQQTNIVARPSPLYFQGGNIIETRDHVLVGMDYVRENEGRQFMETRAAVLEQFAQLFGKKVLAVGREELILHRDRQYLGGGVFQPIFHIDMYITPTGQHAEDGREVVFVASPRLAREILGEKETENDFDIYFDEVADQLREHFEVKRMPLLPTQFRSKESDWPRHYYLSYNNVLVENFVDGSREHRHIYMPTFASQVEMFKSERYLTAYYGDRKRYERLDEGAEKIWKDAGFKVYRMDGLEDLAMSWGAVHCMVKTLQRTHA